jgi:hypothetical protein
MLHRRASWLIQLFIELVHGSSRAHLECIGLDACSHRAVVCDLVALECVSLICL